MNPLTRERHSEMLPMLDCPRWDRCDAPLCPLDPEMETRSGPVDQRSFDGGAQERRCPLSRGEREELGADLPWRGLWPRELKALLRWERLAVTRQVAGVR